jgi:hypothetical protein
LPVTVLNVLLPGKQSVRVFILAFLRLSVVGQFGQFPPFLDVMEADVSNVMTLMFLMYEGGHINNNI